jgi:putative pyruvate formate lyase activating enzyme
MCELERAGALNINLVTPLHFAPHIREAVMRARTAGMALPIVCNTSGYETVETLRAMEDCVDIWLTTTSTIHGVCRVPLTRRRLSDVAEAALLEMAAQLHRAGGRAERADGSMTRGIMYDTLFYLVYRGLTAVIDRVWQLVEIRSTLSVMNQYTPNEPCRARHDDLARSVTDEEYETVLDTPMVWV